MEAIDKMGSFSYYATYAITGFLTLLPLVSFFGHIFSEEGRKSLWENKLLMMYFILFFPFAYFYWFDQETIALYTGISGLGLKLTYAIATFAPLLDTKAVE
ncbi:MAG TPA: hypothetical protein DIV86_00755 [Alphaproteobacteria bacterium]|nr:hypothetical protein [Alphaproteobacteria bacterium]